MQPNTATMVGGQQFPLSVAGWERQYLEQPVPEVVYNTTAAGNPVGKKRPVGRPAGSTLGKSGGPTKKTPPKKGVNEKADTPRDNSAKEVWSGLPTEKLDGGWPDGWTKKTYERQSGKTAGSTDSYWYSPITQVRLRSMAEVKRFLNALAQCNGDESLAWKQIKQGTDVTATGSKKKEIDKQTKKEKSDKGTN